MKKNILKETSLMSTEKKILRVVAEILETPEREIRPSDDFISDLGVTSLDIVSLVWRIEDVFDLEEIPESSLEQITTVADLIALVLEQKPEKTETKPFDASTYDVALASDHAALGLKSELVAWLEKSGYRVIDLGPKDNTPVDYPEYAQSLAEKVMRKEANFGVLICGSGIGMSIAANKVNGLRAAMVSEPVSAALARQHNDANVVCMGARMIGTDMAIQCLKAFLNTPFEPGDDGRHQRRVQRIAQIETNQLENRTPTTPSTASSLLPKHFRR